MVKRAKTGADVSNYDEINFKQVIDIDPLIKSFYDKYADNLEEQIGIGNGKLPSALDVATLLNEIFGPKPTITRTD